jgi:hypothetical protein
MKNIIHTHSILPPSLYTSHTSGKKYIVPGWIEVDLKTQLEDIKWVKEKNIKIEPKIETFEFKSSSSSEIYITRKYLNLDGSVSYRCNCPGSFRSRGNCKHIKSLKENG